MDERHAIVRELGGIEQELKALEILYEQYFAGAEKREPMQKREAVSKRLRQFVNRKIIQTDLRFRYQTVAARFFSYTSYWDRIVRLIDEGRYARHTGKSVPEQPSPSPPAAEIDLRDRIYQDLLAARASCQLSGTPPERDQVYRFLDLQRDKIREKFGDREVEFRVVTEEGKPKIKVRAKQ